MVYLVSNADGVGFGSTTFVAYVNIETPRSKEITSKIAQHDVVAAGCVTKERVLAIGRVIGTRCVTDKCSETSGSVLLPSRVAKERLPTVGRVVGAGCVRKKRIKTVGRITDASGI